jgi:hypothetical protein
MKYNNFLQGLKLLNPNTYVRVVAGFGDRSGFNSDEWTFSNVQVFICDDDYELAENEINLEFGVIDSNYLNKVLTVNDLISKLDIEGKSEIERFIISPEGDSDGACHYFDAWPGNYFDAWPGSKSQLKIKVISDDLIEIYLDHLP